MSALSPSLNLATLSPPDAQEKIHHVIGIGEMKVATDCNEVLATYSLGSCVGLTLYDPSVNVGAMIHCMLPLSSSNREKAEKTPTLFTDTGVMLALQAVMDLGAKRDSLIARVAGGAALLDENGTFRIGERNYTVLRKVLWKNDILIASKDVGGSVARTMFLHMDSGKTTIRIKGHEKKL